VWSLRFATRKLIIAPIIEPTVGIHPSGLISTSMKSLMNLDASCLREGIPPIAGYKDETPFLKAAISASTATGGVGSPGTPISILTKGIPVFFSIRSTRNDISRIDAEPTGGSPFSFASPFINSAGIGIFSIIQYIQNLRLSITLFALPSLLSMVFGSTSVTFIESPIAFSRLS